MYGDDQKFDLAKPNLTVVFSNYLNGAGTGTPMRPPLYSRPLGEDAFVENLQQVLGRSLRPQKPEPKWRWMRVKYTVPGIPRSRETGSTTIT